MRRPGSAGRVCTGSPCWLTCMSRLATGTAGRRTMRRLRRTGNALPGSGACAHPDGVVHLVQSALDVFEYDVIRHRAGGPAGHRSIRPYSPLRRHERMMRVVVHVDPDPVSRARDLRALLQRRP